MTRAETITSKAARLIRQGRMTTLTIIPGQLCSHALAAYMLRIGSESTEDLFARLSL